LSNQLTKSLTSQQLAFLDALVGPAKGNMKKAAELAGYSPKTRMVDIVTPLKDHIINAIKDILVSNGPTAAFGLVDAIIDPSQVGTQHRIKAATEILDRIGVVKPEVGNENVNKPAIFILPPKGINQIKVDSTGDVTIDMEDTVEEIKEVVTEPEERDYSDPRMIWTPILETIPNPNGNLTGTPTTGQNLPPKL
jgi:hypothetical protein